MAYKKEYPVLNSEKKEDSIEQWTRRQEDRIEEAFNDLRLEYADLTANSGFEFGSPNEGWVAPRAYKYGNFVWLEGTVNEGIAGNRLCRLPGRFRPSGTMQFATGGSSTGDISVLANGDVIVNRMGVRTFLNGICFYAG